MKIKIEFELTPEHATEAIALITALTSSKEEMSAAGELAFLSAMDALAQWLSVEAPNFDDPTDAKKTIESIIQWLQSEEGDRPS